VTAPLVLCIDRSTYAAAVAALAHVLASVDLPPDLSVQFAAAQADLRMAMWRAFEHDAEVTPALLRRQI
jgi:hypothetical protein